MHLSKVGVVKSDRGEAGSSLNFLIPAPPPTWVYASLGILK